VSGGYPLDLAVHPNQRFIYAVGNLDQVLVYTVSTSSPSERAPACSATMTSTLSLTPYIEFNLASIAVEPSGKFAYTTNLGEGKIGEYSIDQTTGAVTLIGKVNAENPFNPSADPLSATTTH
jgi:6-phosphogluconolactonase